MSSNSEPRNASQLPRSFGEVGKSAEYPANTYPPRRGGSLCGVFGAPLCDAAPTSQSAIADLAQPSRVPPFKPPTNLSVSQIENWLRCPLGWYGRSVAKWPQPIDGRMARGRVLHSAFEVHHKRGDVELELLKSWRDAVSQGVTLTYVQAMTVLERYQRSNPAQPNDRPEVRFRLPIPDIEPACSLWGYIDLVRGSELHEMKTVERLVTAKGVRRWTQEHADEQMQATAYAWAFQTLYGALPRHIVYHVISLDGSEPIRLRTYRTAEQIGAFLELARRVYGEITSGHPIEPKCSPSRCYYPDQCAAYREPASGDRAGAASGVLESVEQWPSLRVD